MFNLLFILTTIAGLGVFSYMISLIILVLGIKSLDSDIEYSIIKTWIINIKKHYKKALKLSLFYSVFGFVFIFDTMYFYLILQSSPSTVYTIFYYLFLVIDIFFLFAIINAAFVFVYFPNLDIKKNIKYSFKLIQLVPMQAIILMVLLILTVVWFYVFPLVIVFIWFSVIIYCYHTMIKRTYSRLVADEVKSLDMYDEY
jgi:uncharacterized membrane protein YesL